MTTEPITTADVLNVTRAVHDIAQTMSVTLGSKSTAQLGARRAQSYRAAADFRRATVRIGLSWETVPSLRR